MLTFQPPNVICQDLENCQGDPQDICQTVSCEADILPSCADANQSLGPVQGAAHAFKLWCQSFTSASRISTLSRMLWRLGLKKLLRFPIHRRPPLPLPFLIALKAPWAWIQRLQRSLLPNFVIQRISADFASPDILETRISGSDLNPPVTIANDLVAQFRVFKYMTCPITREGCKEIYNSIINTCRSCQP
jgi:hypothetical protein